MDLSDIDFSSVAPVPQKGLEDLDFHSILGVPKATDLAAADATANPDQAAKALKIAPQLGLTPAAVDGDFANAQEQSKRLRATQAISESPALQQWIEQSDNPLVTKIANDDYEKLGAFEKAMTKLGGISPKPFGPETIEHGIHAFESANYARAASQYALGDVTQEGALKAFEARPRAPEAGWTDPAGMVAELVGGLASNMLYGGSKGAVVGAGAGALVGGPAGAAVGAAVGTHIGTSVDMAQTAYGSAYRATDLYRDEYGRPMGETSKQAVAIASGVLTGMAATLGGPMIAKSFSGAVTPFLLRTFGDKAVETSLAKSGQALAQAGITGGGLNVALELAQTLPFEVAKQMGSDPHALLNDPARAIEYAKNLGNSFAKGVALFGGLAGLPIGANYYMDRARIRQTQLNAQARDSAFNEAVGSLTRERSPETFADFAKFAGDDTHIPAAVVGKLRETDPTAFNYVPDVDRKIADALPHDGDLVIPTHEYFAHTKEDHHAAVAADIRSATGLTLNEAKALEEHWVAYHGTAATFDKFDSKWRLTGEGANVYGAGHYVAERKGIAESYYEQLAQQEHFVGGKPLDETNPAHIAAQYLDKHLDNAKDAIEDLQNEIIYTKKFEPNTDVITAMEDAVEHIRSGKPVESMSTKLSGNLYQVRVKADPRRMLHWDKPLGEQTPEVQAALRSMGHAVTEGQLLDTGESFMREQTRIRANAITNRTMDRSALDRGKMEALAGEELSGALRDAGLHGIQYYDAASRGARTTFKIEGKGIDWTNPREALAASIAEKGLDSTREAAKERLNTAERHLADQDGINFVKESSDADFKKAYPDKTREEALAFQEEWSERYREDFDEATRDLELLNNPETLPKAEAIIEPQTHNLVIFHDDHLEITHVNGEPVPKKVADDPLGQALVRNLTETTEKARKALWLDPIIVPDAAGMSKEAFRRWSKHLQETQRAATKAAFDVAAREIRRRESPLWKDASAKMAEEVEADLTRRADFTAERILRGQEGGEFGDFRTKFDKADVDELFSAAEQTAMGASPSSLLRKDLIGSKDTLHPDAIAELSGHGSGKELISELINLERDRRARGETPREQFRRTLKEETARRMEERYGNLDENVMREAMDLAMSVEQIKVLHDDMEKIVKAGDLPVQLNREMVERAAKDRIAAMPAKDAAKTRSFELAVAVAGAKAEAALLKGDYAEAFQHKQVQFQNFLMARESKRIARDLAGAERLIGQMKNLTIDTWDQGILDGAHALLEQIGVKAPRSTENLLQALADQGPDVRNFDTFVADRAAKGIDIIPLPDGFPHDYKTATAEQVGYLRQTLESLAFHARDQQKLSLGEQMEAFNSVMDAIHTNLDSMRTKFDPDAEGWAESWKHHGRQFDAMLLRMEQLAAWFDKNDPLGPFTQSVIRPLKEAQHGKDAMLRELVENFSKLPGDKRWHKSLGDKVTNTVLLDSDGNLMKMTRGKLVSMILNMGNEQNLRVLVEGRKWDEGTVREFVRANAKKEDYDFAQAMWDMLDKQWEKVAEAGRRNTGVRPERVQPLTLDTDFGRYRGGYYPLFQDRGVEPITKLDRIMADGDINPVVAQASAMRARTGAVYPVELSMDRLPSNLRNLAHSVNYTGAVRNAYKVLSDRSFRQTVTEKFGPEYTDLFMPWLKDIAQDGGRADSRGEAWYNNISAIARANSVYMLIGWRPSTAMIHGGAALTNSIYEVGLRPLMSAYKDILFAKPEDILSATDQLYRNPQNTQSMWTWAMEQSGELRNRNHNIDRDVRRAQDRAMFGETDWRSVNAYHATWFVSTLDIASAVPVWIAEYKAARLAGKTHEDAVYIGDRAVRQAHGSSGLVDQPEIQRMGEASKWFTTFYGYFNHNYNRQRDTGRMLAEIPSQVRAGDVAGAFGSVGRAFAQSVAYLLAPAIIHEWVRPHAKEDESWAGWAGKAMALQGASTVPFLRDAAQGFISGQLPRTAGPMGELLAGGLYHPIKDLHDTFDPDKNVSNDAVKHLLEIPGWYFGFPMSRYSAGTWQFIWDKTRGNETDDDYWRLLLDGNPKHRKQH